MRWMTPLKILFIGVVAAGCSATAQNRTETAYPIEAQAIPVEPVNNKSAYPDPQVDPNNPTLEPYQFGDLEPETISAHGFLVVLNPFSAIPDANDAIFLVPLAASEQNISGIPPINTNGTVQAEVDERTGEFQLTGIHPGQYAIVVRELTGAEIPARMGDSDSMAVFTFSESERGTLVDLGFLMFP